jgi:hypothetical protein
LWATQATFGLIGRDKLELVNDERPIPISKKPNEPREDEKKALREWRRDDKKVCNWLIETIEPNISEVMSYYSSAQAMLEKTENLFSRKRNYAHNYQL